MSNQDAAFQPLGLVSPHITKNVAKKTCKIFSLQHSLFLCQSNFTVIKSIWPLSNVGDITRLKIVVSI